MTEEDRKTLFEYLRSIQENVDKILQDKNDDTRAILDKYTELMLAISRLSTQTQISNDETTRLIKTIKGEHKETRELVEGHTKVVVKEVDKTKKRWFQVWKRA